MSKNYQKPEFQLVRQDLANAKFFAASSPSVGGFTTVPTSTAPNAASSLNVASAGDWF